MELKNQVCSLELSQKLKKLGVKQESFYCYVQHRRKELKGIELWSFDRMEDYNNGMSEKAKVDFICFAFTIAELGEMLPIGFAVTKYHNAYRISKSIVIEKETRDEYEEVSPTDFEAKTEADARAKMLIYLIENKLIKL